MEIIDNINRLLGDDLKQTIKPGAKLKIAAACFSIYAYEALKHEHRQAGRTVPQLRHRDVRRKGSPKRAIDFDQSRQELFTCFETGANEDFVKQIAVRKPLRVVFRDAVFANGSVKINVERIFKLMSPATEIKTI